MYLTRHATPHGPCWAVDGIFLPEGLGLDTLLSLPADAMKATLAAAQTGVAAKGDLLPPIEHAQEAWAAGVTYLQSREARMAESDTADIYAKVYEADRVEVFFKAVGWRAMGPGQPIRVRKDSTWDVPEPELAIVINSAGEIVGYTAGNDVSSRSIEGENPLYLPQAKVYDGSCAIGPGIVVAGPDAQRNLPIKLSINRGGKRVFEGETATSQLKRQLEEMAGWLFREITFPQGAILLTGTCLVPADEFTLTAGDVVRVQVGELVLENPVE
ncbi:MAG: 2-dehydro-3-deoxy-D-arabinonate dehydratase [Gammaproteobacteria bacterium]|jgi:2-dehydro-3-deoxy-D-arabinonate dehydratase